MDAKNGASARVSAATLLIALDIIYGDIGTSHLYVLKAIVGEREISEAIISGSYTLINEAMSLNFWLRVAVRQPSNMKGQIYIPSVNILLWVGCVLVVLYFQTSTNMEAAYGFSITVAMLMTSVLLAYFLLFIKKWRKRVVFSILAIFATVEISFLVANLQKFNHGGSVAVFIGCFFFSIMYIWYYARKINNSFVKFIGFCTSTAPMNLIP